MTFQSNKGTIKTLDQSRSRKPLQCHAEAVKNWQKTRLQFNGREQDGVAIKIDNESSVKIDEPYVSQYRPDRAQPKWNAVEKDSNGTIDNLIKRRRNATDIQHEDAG